MSERLAYAGWASMTLRDAGQDGNQDARHYLFSPKGKVANYTLYKNYCKENGYEFDPPPSNYWQMQTKWYHYLIAAGLLFMFAWAWAVLLVALGVTFASIGGKK